ncbi:putative zinc transporter zrg17 [Hyphodiscus hymeniophilus]|uniref:Zinc transporter n=1 Tax=Hyphodiscus hymeniophilus TaxID=353542 RepID=A0A9P6VIN7_9HELO|nr:putative zinc transporter zrg17 [Hyphodiscus hymeniophilus]
MASSLPIPAPPRTPTPPTPIAEEEAQDEGGLGIGGVGRTVFSTVAYDPNSLSPLTDTFPARFGSMQSSLDSSADAQSPLSSDGAMAAHSVSTAGGKGPFNFQTQTIKDTPVVAKSQVQNISRSPVIYANSPSNSPCLPSYQQFTKSATRTPIICESSPQSAGSEWLIDLPTTQNIGQRRGHRYKHSSVSTQHQIFLEPPPRAPLALPASLPIPTIREAWKSMSKEQKIRSSWCACHFSVAAYVLYSASGSLALTALSHLIFFDAVSAVICVVVDVGCNFEVWKRSSIRHPFGLERAEVLAGFAMSVFLLFMSFDLISHNLKHVLESLGSHTPHHPHSHQRVSPGSVDSAALLSIVATLISAIGLKNHARIGKAMRFVYISSLPSVLSNPSHFLTLSCSTVMLLLPLLSITFFLWLDRLLCIIIALSMFFLGFQLAIAQGLMLLMSYSGKGVSEVMREITTEPLVSGVEEARFWQVHYGLCMANLKLRVRGSGGGAAEDAQIGRLRERICLLVKNRLGGGYGRGGGLKWEVTVQMTSGGGL